MQPAHEVIPLVLLFLATVVAAQRGFCNGWTCRDWLGYFYFDWGFYVVVIGAPVLVVSAIVGLLVYCCCPPCRRGELVVVHHHGTTPLLSETTSRASYSN